MGLRDRLEDLTQPGTTVPGVTSPAPPGWEPGVRFRADGSLEAVTLPAGPALEDEASWEAAVASLGVKVPDGYRVRLLEARFDPAAWHRDTPGEAAYTAPVWRYRFAVDIAPARVDVDELLRYVRPRKTAPKPGAGACFVFAAGDLQLGKVDGDGSRGTVERFYDSLDRALARYKALRKRGQAGPVLLAWVGDCIEGLVSQGGALAASGRLDLTLTEQVRVFRRLMAEQVDAFTALEERVHVAVVPGNHDEAERVGKSVRRFDDSWAIEAAAQVAETMAARGRSVDWTFPGRDEMHLTVMAAGSRVGLLHGHQTRGGMEKWLASKALARDAIGTADLVLSGHFHHLRLEQMGATTWVQTGALDGGSRWWEHSGGLPSPPAAVTLLTEDGLWSGLEVV